jgi:FKBP-type peptidyl-prolyl cis-trans isomerase
MRFFAGVIALGMVGLAGCGDSPTGPTALVIEDVVVGTGPTALVGNTVTVHYIGTLQDGTKFDSSYDKGTPLTFRIGTGQVIQGWNQGVPGMKVGGKRRLIIPPSLAYGTTQVGSIPAGSTLTFVIELISIQGK